MVKGKDFPIEQNGDNLIIDPVKMKIGIIYCFEYKGDNYQAEIDRLGVVTILKEIIK